MPDISPAEPAPSGSNQSEWFFSQMPENMLEVRPERFLAWKRKRKRFRFILAPSQSVDLGAWSGFGWPEDDLPAAAAHFEAQRRYESGPYRAYYFRSAQVMGPQLVIGTDRSVIAESTRGIGILLKSGWFRPGSRPTRLISPEAGTSTRRDGLSVVIGTRASGAYFHWMVEMLPRLFLGADLARQHDGTLLMLPIKSAFQWETLSLVARDTRVAFTEADVTHCEEALFPDHMIQQGEQLRVYSPLMGLGFDRLLTGFRIPDTKRRRRLYISRRDAARRHVLNEDALEPTLRRHGFEIVTLSGESVARQAALFREAEIVIGLHGAGLTNTGFCQAGTPVVEILPIGSRFLSPYYRLAGLRDLPYLCLAGHDGAGGMPDINRDYVVAPDALEKAILAAEALRRD